MVKQENRLYYLLDRLVAHDATPAELDELSALAEQQDAVMPEAEAYLQGLQPSIAAPMPETDAHLHDLQAPVYDKEKWMLVADKILASDKQPVRRISLLRRYWAAAAVLLLLAAGAYMLRPRQQRDIKTVTEVTISPGKEGAILTLANGAQIVLDSLGNGIVAAQQGAQVMLRNGKLTYHVSGQAGGETQYNILSTPKGRQFSITLPDGTSVWLNAASAIRYPTRFDGKERRVSISGEAYFEVATHTVPFKVSVDGKAEIQVLGTRFNVNAYRNENIIRTTLLQGAVRVVKGGSQAILAPGQQAMMNGNISINQHVNIDRVMAWKNGIFNFDGLSLEEAMRQLERWYDIEAVYENGVPDIQFGGKMDRSVSLSGLLKMLAGAKLKYRIEEGKKLVITK